MNYRWHYDRLIERGKRTLIHGYRERHHIIPKCLGGDNSKDNLVWLTAEEHFVAHQLLIKIYPNEPKLIFAAHMMCNGNNRHARNNKLYGWIREKSAEAKKGISNRENFKHSEESKKKTSASLIGRKCPSRGRPQTEEQKKAQSERTRLMNQKRREEGWTMPQEARKKISESRKVPWSEKHYLARGLEKK